MTVTDNPGTALKEGRIVGIAGPVIDVEFPRGHLPEINTALELDVTMDGEATKIVAETAQQIGDSRVRAICLRATDGLTRGAPVRNLGHGIQMPVGRGRARPRVQRDRPVPRRRARSTASTTTGPSTATPPPSTPSSPRPRCSRPASRSSTS